MFKRILNLGAGVQSTCLAIMSADGELEHLDAALFADTGWEPDEVYTHLDAVERYLGEHDIPVYRCSAGKLQDDVLDPLVFATIPCWTLTTEESEQPAAWGPCGSCDGFQMLSEDDAFCEDCMGMGMVPMEWRTVQGAQRLGRILRQCTPKYKVDPLSRKLRELCDAPIWNEGCKFCEETGIRVAPWSGIRGPCSLCRGSGVRRRVGRMPTGVHVEQWIGFSIDEWERATTVGFPQYVTVRWPLMEKKWTRQKCNEWMAERGWSGVSKSACIGCPFHDDETWLEMADYRPKQFAALVEYDAKLRQGDNGLRAQRFLHEARLPLDEAVEQYRCQKAEAGEQGVFWDEYKKKRIVRSCNPFGCRSEEVEDPVPITLTIRGAS